MVRKILVLGICVSSVFFVSCLGEDPNTKGDVENTVAMCTDGDDNDGDYDYDCYDSDCRALDSTRVANGDSSFCPYDSYRESIDRSSPVRTSSAARTSSNSNATASSSSVTQAAGGFPYLFPADAADSLQIFSMFRKNGSNKIAFAGRMRQHGLYGVIDTAGHVVVTPDVVRAYDDLDANSGAVISNAFYGIDTNENGDHYMFGSTRYTNKPYATAFYREGNTGAWKISFRSTMTNYAFIGSPTSTTRCYVMSNDTVGYLSVDLDLADQAPISIAIVDDSTRYMGAVVVGQTCASVGTRALAAGNQLWLSIIDKNNDKVVSKRITTGGSNESAYSIASADGKYYVAAKVGTAPRLLVLSSTYAVENDGATQSLSGTPYRVRIVKDGSTTKVLMVGQQSGKGAVWLFSADGSLLASKQVTGAAGLTDVIQLGDGNLLVSGWKANSGSTGTTAVIVRLDLELDEI